MEKKGLLIVVLIVAIVVAALFVSRGMKRRQRVPSEILAKEITAVCEDCLHVETKAIKEWQGVKKDPVTGWECPECGKLKMRQPMKCPHCGETIPGAPSWGAGRAETETPSGEPARPVHPAYNCPKCKKEIIPAVQ